MPKLRVTARAKCRHSQPLEGGARQRLGPPVSTLNGAGCLGCSRTPPAWRSGNRGRRASVLQTPRCGALGPKGGPAGPAVSQSLNPGAGLQRRPSVQGHPGSVRLSPWGAWAGPRVGSLSAHQPKGPAAESALSLQGLPYWESALSVHPGASASGSQALECPSSCFRLAGPHEVAAAFQSLPASWREGREEGRERGARR